MLYEFDYDICTKLREQETNILKKTIFIKFLIQCLLSTSKKRTH